MVRGPCCGVPRGEARCGRGVGGGDLAADAVRQAVPVPLVDAAGAASDRPRVNRQQRLAVRVRDGGVQRSLNILWP